MLSSGATYRLGSMPGRVWATRCHGAWTRPEQQAAAQTMVAEWVELLGAIKDKTLLPDVRALKEVIEGESQRVAAKAKQKRRQVVYDFLQKTDQRDLLPPLAPPTESEPEIGSYELARDLVGKAEQAGVREHLPSELHEAFDLGVRVGRCMAGDADARDTMTIWTIMGRRGLQEWVTGKPAGTPLGPRQSIHTVVLDRLTELDEVLSHEGLPGVSATGPTPSSPEIRQELVEIRKEVGQVRLAAQKIERGQETLGCDLVRVSETIECMADDTADSADRQQALTVRQCAERANTTIPMIKAAIKRGELKAKALRQRGAGTEYRVLESDLEQWLSTGQREHGDHSEPKRPIAKGKRPPLPNYLKR